MLQSTTRFRVRYAETDAQGIVHHSNYLVWFELGRSELLREAGLPYAEVEKMGFVFVVGRAELKYKKPAVYDELIRLETSLVRTRRRIVEFGYAVYNQQDQLLASGRTIHMVLGQDRQPASLPPEVAALLGQA